MSINGSFKIPPAPPPPNNKSQPCAKSLKRIIIKSVLAVNEIDCTSIEQVRQCETVSVEHSVVCYLSESCQNFSAR